MSYSPTNLLLSLAYALAQAVQSGGGQATLGQDLFVHQLPASASNTSGGAAVMRIFGGPAENDLRPVPTVSVQCMTYAPGEDAGAGLQFAQRLYDALHDSGNADRPRQTWSVAAKKLDANGNLVDDDNFPGGWDIRLVVLTSGPPAILGRGDASTGGRWEISFNFNVRLTAPE